jgi:hypothetical protein
MKEDDIVYGVTCANQTSHIIHHVAGEVSTTVCGIQRVGERGEAYLRDVSCTYCTILHAKCVALAKNPYMM